MKQLKHTDKKGFETVFALRDKDNEAHPEQGVPVNIDLRDLDWDVIPQELHNSLVNMGLLTWLDVEKSPNGILDSAILGVMKRRIIRLYRDADKRKEK